VWRPFRIRSPDPLTQRPIGQRLPKSFILKWIAARCIRDEDCVKKRGRRSIHGLLFAVRAAAGL
jgi:hypothetical protein